MERSAKRVQVAVLAATVLAAGLWIWMASTRNRVNPDSELDLVQSTRPSLRVTDGLRLDVRAFYDGRDQAPAWISEIGVLPIAATALDTLDAAATHGLNPSDYDALDLRLTHQQLSRTDANGVTVLASADALMHFEVRLTSALLSLGHDVSVGRVPPASIDPSWQSLRTPPDLPRTLATAINGRVDQWLPAIQPRHAEYAALLAVLADEQRLAATGVDDAAMIVAANMERWRWMPDDLGARHLFVNIPSYTLVARESGKTTLSMKVVVGKARTNQTPVLSSEISSIVFSPTWGIPASIVANETVPAILRDPSYLRRQNIDVTAVTKDGVVAVDASTIVTSNAAQLRRLFYRQRPGPGNALGRVKFPFPNAHDVYLHDTPSDGSFAQTVRALSHGCVRLEQPAVLAEYVLRELSGWTPSRITRAMNQRSEQYVKLAAPLPVHLAYFTASVDAGGALRLLPDIYGYDLRNALRQFQDDLELVLGDGLH